MQLTLKPPETKHSNHRSTKVKIHRGVFYCALKKNPVRITMMNNYHKIPEKES